MRRIYFISNTPQPDRGGDGFRAVQEKIDTYLGGFIIQMPFCGLKHFLLLNSCTKY